MPIVAGAEDAGKRLDAFLHERLAEFSRSRCNPWIKEQRVLVNATQRGLRLCCAARDSRSKSGRASAVEGGSRGTAALRAQ